MAKGDKEKAQNQTTYQTSLGQEHLNNLRSGNIVPQSQGMWNNYAGGSERNISDYDSIMQGYRDYAGLTPGVSGGGGGGGPTGPKSLGKLDPKYRGYVDRSLQGYENFANTGGFSPDDLSNIRARAISPTRAVYANAQRNMDRSKALQGGYAPNYIAAQAKTARDLSQSMSDANTNANAEIAQMVQQGKLAGLGGMQAGGFGQQGIDLDIAKTNASLAAQAAAAARASSAARAGNQLSALRGMTDLYGTNPAMANVFGNQVLGAQGNMLDLERLQLLNGQNAIQGQQGAAGIPGNYQTGAGNTATALGIIGQLGGVYAASQNGKTDPYRSFPYGNGGYGQYGTPPYVQQDVNKVAQSGQGSSWWQKALSIAGAAAPYVAMAASDRNLKKDIKPLFKNRIVSKKLRELPLYTWKYKGDNTTHMGPMAQDFKKHFGVGDGKNIHLADVMGVVLASQQESLKG